MVSKNLLIAKMCRP